MQMVGNENLARSFSDRHVLTPLGSRTSAPSGHGRPRQNACFTGFRGLTEVFASGRPPGYPRGRPRDIRLGCFFVPEMGCRKGCVTL